MKHWSQDFGTHGSLVDRITKIPHCMLKNHDLNALAQVVLYFLGHNDCFSFKHAAYFVDNPDFNCLKGSAGYRNGETHIASQPLCETPHSFVHEIEHAPYNKLVRDIARPSIKRECENVENSPTFIALCKELGVKHPDCVCWPLKHGNYGMLIFEHEDRLDLARRGLLDNAVSLLGFCPVS